jgi:hypothetical protein
MRASILLLTLILICQFKSAKAQDYAADPDVQSAIETLFEGMRTNDSAMVAKVFIRDAIMQTVLVNEQGSTYLNNGSLDGFLKAVGTDKSEIWDEQILSYEINIDGNLASAWTPYQFYRGEEFSHCGVNSFQLMKTNEGWKIFHIVDTRRTDGCEVK